MSKTAWIIFSVVCVGLLSGLVYLSGKNKVDISGRNINAVQAASSESGTIGDHVFGQSDSKVVLIEYGDFQCPGCGSLHPRLKTVTEDYKDKITFIFRNFPLTTIHPNALAAAASAEAAGLQGKYWEMHNKLYENQSTWENISADQRIDFFAGYARELDLDEAKFRSDVASSNVSQKIAFDQALGKSQKVSATPTLFLNTTQVQQATWTDEAALRSALDAELKKNGIEPPTASSTTAN